MQSKNYSFVIIALIIICAIVIVGCSKNKAQEGPCDSEKGFLEAVESNNYDYCMNIQETYCQDYCRFTIARSSDDANNCEKIEDNEHKDLCYSNLATSLKDLSLCDKMSTNTIHMKSTCEHLYYEKYGYPTK